MNIIDIVIIVILILGFLVGSSRGFTKQLVSCLGFIVTVVLAFILKNPVSEFLYEHLPFFDFLGVFKGITILNILLYEVIAFLLVLAILNIIWRILLTATSIFEKFLEATIILGIPSKILGGILGVLENYVLIFIALYILSLPFFDIKVVDEARFKDPIINQTPILSSLTLDNFKVIDEFKLLKDKYEVTTDAEQFNLEALDLLLKYDIITVESAQTLVDKGKLKMNNVDVIIKKYS